MPSLVVEACTVLGVEPGRSGTPPDEDVVASAFKKLAMKWHPDRNPDNVKEATQRFAELSAARDLLLDPPTNALLDDPQRRPPNADPYPKSAHSKGLRAFEGDVTEDIESGALGGQEAVELFEKFGLWAVWKCDTCDAVCCRIRKNKYSCMCGQRLRAHDAGRGFRCVASGCRRYEFMVQDTEQPHKCRCKHAPADHEPLPPYRCRKCTDCVGFDSPWVCNCGHPPSAHRTCFVRQRLPERSREWVAGGLRVETVALANKFRSRSVSERVSFIQRAAAAKAAGFPSWKAMQREARQHATHGTRPEEAAAAPPVAPPMNEAASDAFCPECEPVDGTMGGSASSMAGSRVDNGTGADGVAAAVERGGLASMTTEELREKLARAGVGLRPAVASDFG